MSQSTFYLQFFGTNLNVLATATEEVTPATRADVTALILGTRASMSLKMQNTLHLFLIDVKFHFHITDIC